MASVAAGSDTGRRSMTKRPLCVESMARVTQVTMKRIAPAAVTLDMTMFAPPPNSDWAAAPPNVSDLPPRPPCTRMTAINRNETTIWTINTRRYILFGHRLCFERRLHDGTKPLRFQAGPADQRPIDIGLLEQDGRIGRIDAAAVLDAHRGCRLRPAALADPLSNERVGFLSLVRRGVFAGADRPDRLIREDDESTVPTFAMLKGYGELTGQHVERPPAFPLRQRFPDADDRNEPMGKRCGQFPIH